MSLGDDAFFGVVKQTVEAGAIERCRTRAAQLRVRLFQEQRDFIDDPERHKALLCSRRSGKTYAIAMYMFMVCLRRPFGNVVFIAKTRDKAREIIWELMKRLNSEFELQIKFSEVHTAGWFANGSRFRLRGCETLADIDQFRGEPFDAVFVDEAASFPAGVLDPLLDQALEATLGDRLGTMVLAGTPGPVLAGRFYRTTGEVAFEPNDKGVYTSRPYALKHLARWQGVKFGWSFHTWARANNVTIPHLDEEARRIKELNGWTDQNPTWLREYADRPRWITNTATLVYHFDPAANLWTPGKRTKANPFGLPEPDKYHWRYVGGIDFGHKDPFAIEVVAYSDCHNGIFQCYEFNKRGLHIPQWAEEIKRVQGLVEIEQWVADFGPYKDLLPSQLAAEYGLSVQVAQKSEKRDHIDLLNADFADKRCWVMEGSEVASQMLVLSWDETHLKEKSGQRNDCCDALVYTWRRVQHHFYSEPDGPAPEYGSPAWEAQFAAEEVASVIEQEQRARDEWDDGSAWQEDQDPWA